MMRPTKGSADPVVALASLLLLTALSCARDVFTAADLARIRAAGDPIVKQLENFKQRTGSYPRSLEEARVQNTRTELGSFDYERSDLTPERPCARLWVGDFRNRYGVRVLWNSCLEEPKWVVEE